MKLAHMMVQGYSFNLAGTFSNYYYYISGTIFILSLGGFIGAIGSLFYWLNIVWFFEFLALTILTMIVGTLVITIYQYILYYLYQIDFYMSSSIDLSQSDYGIIGIICGIYLAILILINIAAYVLSNLNLIYAPTEFNWDKLDS